MGKFRDGTRSPANKKLKRYTADLEPETLAAWKEAAARMGLSLRQATEYVYRDAARRYGVDIPAHPGPTRPPKPPLLDC
jgi:hypothetical protein